MCVGACVCVRCSNRIVLSQTERVPLLSVIYALSCVCVCVCVYCIVLY
ncbi:MAG: hypothetical protein P4L40_14555 [Terracidiphilus sp.]|nr:hypothetical protein [Terracidiphilus sp.]